MQQNQFLNIAEVHAGCPQEPRHNCQFAIGDPLSNPVEVRTVLGFNLLTQTAVELRVIDELTEGKR